MENQEKEEKYVLEHLFFALNHIEKFNKFPQYFLKKDEKNEYIKLLDEPDNLYSLMINIVQLVLFMLD